MDCSLDQPMRSMNIREDIMNGFRCRRW